MAILKLTAISSEAAIMGRLLSTLGITIFGSFSFAAFGEPTSELAFNQKQIDKEIQASLSQTMEEMMINLFDDDHQTILVANKEQQEVESQKETTEE